MASLNSAIKNGADSVYIGIEGYNMRANVANFSTNDLKEAVQTCHKADVKLYVCTNTTVKEGDLKELRELMPIIKSSGADAVIVSDLGALNIASENQIPSTHECTGKHIQQRSIKNTTKTRSLKSHIIKRKHTQRNKRNSKKYQHGDRSICTRLHVRSNFRKMLFKLTSLQQKRKLWRMSSTM